VAVKNRIVELKMLPPSRLREHPLNFRMHPENQKTVVQQLLEKFGIVDALAVYKTKGDQYMIVNGHLRRDILSDEKQIPCLVLDIDDAEAEAVLAVWDESSKMAVVDERGYDKLLKGLKESYEDIARLFDRDFHDRMPDLHQPEKETPKYPIVANFDEGYDAVIIFSTGEIEWSRLVTVLGLPKEKDRRGEVGMTRIIPAKTFLEMWDKQKK
jgi:hypothetical protein